MWIWETVRWVCVLGWTLAVRYWWACLAVAVVVLLAAPVSRAVKR